MFTVLSWFLSSQLKVTHPFNGVYKLAKLLRVLVSHVFLGLPEFNVLTLHRQYFPLFCAKEDVRLFISMWSDDIILDVL